MKLIPVKTGKQIETIEKLAREIIPDFYAAYIPVEHSLLFVEKYQTTTVLKKQIEEGLEYYLLINADKKEVGYVGFQLMEDKLLLSKLYVLPSHRGNKLGQLALDFAGSRAMQGNASRIELRVSQNNTGAINFYRRNGFTVAEEVTSYTENGIRINGYDMIKYLK